MITLKLFVLVLSLVLLLMAAFKVPELPRISWGWMGAFFAVLSIFVMR